MLCLCPSDPELGQRLEELQTLGEEAVQQSAESLRQAVGHAHATELLSRWEGFGRFCRETLRLASMVLLRAFGLKWSDVAARFGGMPEAKVHSSAAREWAHTWGAAILGKLKNGPCLHAIASHDE